MLSVFSVPLNLYFQYSNNNAGATFRFYFLCRSHYFWGALTMPRPGGTPLQKREGFDHDMWGDKRLEVYGVCFVSKYSILLCTTVTSVRRNVEAD